MKRYIEAISAALIAGLLVYSHKAQADAEGVWLTTGEWSRHENNTVCYSWAPCKEKYRQNNTGIGIELPYNRDASIIAGYYHNSIHHETIYAGMLYQPLHIGPTKFGVMGALATGYTDYIPAVPIASIVGTYEYQKIGINLIWLPTVVVAVQLKVKVW